MSHNYREEDRLKYKPEKTRVLFIETSSTNATFFYHRSSSLFWWTKEAFNKAYEWKLGESKKFLESFKNLGCYLIDFFDEPNKKLKDATSRELDDATEKLAREIENLDPKIIVVTDEELEFYVRRALRKIRRETPIYMITPWGTGNTPEKYIKKLTDLILMLKKEGFLEHKTIL